MKLTDAQKRVLGEYWGDDEEVVYFLANHKDRGFAHALAEVGLLQESLEMAHGTRGYAITPAGVEAKKELEANSPSAEGQHKPRRRHRPDGNV